MNPREAIHSQERAGVGTREVHAVAGIRCQDDNVATGLPEVDRGDIRDGQDNCWIKAIFHCLRVLCFSAVAWRYKVDGYELDELDLNHVPAGSCTAILTCVRVRGIRLPIKSNSAMRTQSIVA